jgi:hypothetical protein
VKEVRSDMDPLTKAVLNRPSGNSYPIAISDGVLKGWLVRRLAAENKAFKTVRRTKQKEPMHKTGA